MNPLLEKYGNRIALGCRRQGFAWAVILRQFGCNELPAVAGGLLFVTRDAYTVACLDSIHVSGERMELPPSLLLRKVPSQSLAGASASLVCTTYMVPLTAITANIFTIGIAPAGSSTTASCGC